MTKKVGAIFLGDKAIALLTVETTSCTTNERLPFLSSDAVVCDSLVPQLIPNKSGEHGTSEKRGKNLL